MIQNVEELSSKLDIEIFRDPLDTIVLEQREIETPEAGAVYLVASVITQQVHARDRVGNRVNNARCRRLAYRGKRSGCDRIVEATEFEVIVGIPRVDGMCAARRRQAIG